MLKTDFEQLLKEKREIVWKEINKYLDNFLIFPQYCQINEKYLDIALFHKQMVSNYPLRKGKYLRPFLVLLTASAMGIKEEKAIKTACAMQVSEDWILNHDDVEDNSLERRGSPALHKIYGKELSINAGDSLHCLMWKILKDNFEILGMDLGMQIMEEFSVMLQRTILGQTAEIKWTIENNLNLTIEDVLFILESKTGYYTISGPMRLGAILAGASKKPLEEIYTFGKILGKAFQITDDLLDLTSDFNGLKKQKGNDIYEGKRTVILVHLLNNVTKNDKEKLIKILSKKREEKLEEEILWVIDKMKEYKSIDFAREMAEKLSKQSKDFFNNNLDFLHKQLEKEIFLSLIDFIVNRDH